MLKKTLILAVIAMGVASPFAMAASTSTITFDVSATIPSSGFEFKPVGLSSSNEISLKKDGGNFSTATVAITFTGVGSKNALRAKLGNDSLSNKSGTGVPLKVLVSTKQGTSEAVALTTESATQIVAANTAADPAELASWESISLIITADKDGGLPGQTYQGQVPVIFEID